MDFADRIKKERNEKKFTQQKLADELHTDQHNISNWENRVCKPNDEHLEALCNLFHRDRAYFYGEIETKTHDNKFILDSTGLSEKSIEKLASILSESNGDNLPDIKADDYKYLEDKQKIASLYLEFINFLLGDEESFYLLMEDLRKCYAKYFFYQTGLNQYKEEENAIRAMGIAKEINLNESGNYKAGISTDQLNDRKASYESSRQLAKENYSRIINKIMQIIYESES